MIRIAGIAKITIPPPPPAPVVRAVPTAAPPIAERAAPAPRGSAVEPAEETTDPEAEAQAARIAFIDGVGARRITHLFAVLQRMGAI